MSLFDDDFYSPKVSPRERRRLSNQDNDRWPASRRLPSFRRPLTVAVAGAAGLVTVLLLISPLWGGRDGGKETPPHYAISPAPEETRLVSVEDIVQRIKPTIVSVLSSQTFSFDGEEETEQQTGIGSGIVYKREGNAAWIVTNHHVIEGASSLEVVSADGKRMTGTVVGSDPLTDLAVLKIDARELAAVAEFGDSDALAEGEGVVALGHPYGLGFSPTVTSGIISSLHRIIPISLAMDGTIDWEMELLQTDAAINHGNSGGALVNQAGQVIGINSMKVAESGVEGLGFAIPSNLAVPIIAELEQYGKVRRPYLGVATVDLDQYRVTDEEEEVVELPEGVEEGVIVLEAYGPASEAGLRTNDVIVALDGRPIDSTLALRKYLYANKKIGDAIRVDYYRDGKKDSVTAQLTETPES
ncbi:MAG TPA: trypsin-like peptidase domain-containing protein [Paenibacillus sp.]|nr:trypsin-like peptidase domain-containing protein [Paenibacillus sp.]